MLLRSALVVCVLAASACKGGERSMELRAETLAAPGGERSVVTGRRLRPRWLEGSDGSRQLVGWRDVQRREDCEFRVASDGAYRCLPIAAATSGLFSDASCETPTVRLAPEADTPAYALELGSVHFPVRARVRKVVGPLRRGAAIYAKRDATCSAAPPPAVGTLLELGPPVAPEEFVAGTVHVDEGPLIDRRFDPVDDDMSIDRVWPAK